MSFDLAVRLWFLDQIIKHSIPLNHAERIGGLVDDDNPD